MPDTTSIVETLRALLDGRSRGQQLYMAALLESGSADRYRKWALETSDPGVADGLRTCADREQAIATTIRTHFARELEEPSDLAALARSIQGSVGNLFVGRSLAERFAVQAEAERGGERLWTELSAEEHDAASRAVLLECATLEAASASYLESLR